MEGNSERKIPFGLKNGKLVGVDEVASGLSCGCVCPSCGFELQANKGEIRAHYFSHNPSADQSECKNAFETAIHLMAKQILAEESTIHLPALQVSRSKKDENGITHSAEASVVGEETKLFSRVNLEQRLNDIRPDIVGYSNDMPLLVEVAVTHFADSDKKQKIRKLGLAAIEIDLSALDYKVTKGELRDLVVEKRDNKRWLSNPSATKVIIGLEADIAAKVQAANRKYAESRRLQHERLVTQRTISHERQRTAQVNVSPSVFNKQYDPRWFVCEACRHLFSIPLVNAPYSLQTIECPECAHQVSAQPPWGRHA